MNLDPNGSFGYIEAIMELCCAVASLLPNFMDFDGFQITFLSFSSLILSVSYFLSNMQCRFGRISFSPFLVFVNCQNIVFVNCQNIV